MAVTVETLEKLERRITLLIPATDLNGEIETRLKKLARTVKADGFRPGKVPMSVVAQRYGYSVQNEVMNDKIGQAFASAANEAQLRVAGIPRVTPKDEAPEGQLHGVADGHDGQGTALQQAARARLHRQVFEGHHRGRHGAGAREGVFGEAGAHAARDAASGDGEGLCCFA